MGESARINILYLMDFKIGESMKLFNLYLRFTNKHLQLDVFPNDYKKIVDKNSAVQIPNNEGGFNVEIVKNFSGNVSRLQECRLNILWKFGNGNRIFSSKETTSVIEFELNQKSEERMLPRGIIAIGECDSGSIIAISVNKNDFGNVYYWEWYWQYPWFIEFFNDRIEKTKERIGWPVEMDEKSDEFKKVIDEFNYATIIKIADTFEEFWNMVKSPNKR